MLVHMLKVYIGIDQSRGGFGLTKIYSDGRHTTYVEKFDPKRLRMSPGVDVLLKIEHWLRATLSKDQWAISHVAMEGYSFGSVNGREKAGELGYAVKRTLREVVAGQARYPTIVTPNQLKLFVTGSGSADKKKMTQTVNARWGTSFTDDNAADSYGLAKIAQAIDTGNTGYPHEKSVIGELKIHTEAPPM